MPFTPLVTLAASPFFAVLASPAGADGNANLGGYSDHMLGHGFGFMGIGMMILFWGAIILQAVFVFRTLTEQKANQGQKSSMDVLKDRLARGEIDPDDFAARAKILSQ